MAAGQTYCPDEGQACPVSRSQRESGQLYRTFQSPKSIVIHGSSSACKGKFQSTWQAGQPRRGHHSCRMDVAQLHGSGSDDELVRTHFCLYPPCLTCLTCCERHVIRMHLFDVYRFTAVSCGVRPRPVQATNSLRS